MSQQATWGSVPSGEAQKQDQIHSQRLAHLVEVKPCDGCGEPIVVVRTHHGKRLPVDAVKLQSAPRSFIVGPSEEVSVTPAVARHKCAPEKLPKVYRKVHDVLVDHPDLQPLWDEMRAAPMARVYDEERHHLAKAAWAHGLAAKGITLDFAAVMIGYTASTPEAGIDWPIDSDGGPRRTVILTELDAEIHGGDR